MTEISETPSGTENATTSQPEPSSWTSPPAAINHNIHHRQTTREPLSRRNFLRLAGALTATIAIASALEGSAPPSVEEIRKSRLEKLASGLSLRFLAAVDKFIGQQYATQGRHYRAMDGMIVDGANQLRNGVSEDEEALLMPPPLGPLAYLFPESLNDIGGIQPAAIVETTGASSTSYADSTPNRARFVVHSPTIAFGLSFSSEPLGEPGQTVVPYADLTPDQQARAGFGVAFGTARSATCACGTSTYLWLDSSGAESYTDHGRNQTPYPKPDSRKLYAYLPYYDSLRTPEANTAGKLGNKGEPIAGYVAIGVIDLERVWLQTPGVAPEAYAWLNSADQAQLDQMTNGGQPLDGWMMAFSEFVRLHRLLNRPLPDQLANPEAVLRYWDEHALSPTWGRAKTKEAKSRLITILGEQITTPPATTVPHDQILQPLTIPFGIPVPNR